MSFFKYIVILCAMVFAGEYSITPSMYSLKQENWAGTFHGSGSPLKVGGYARHQAFVYEGLLYFDLSQINGAILSAKLVLQNNNLGNSGGTKAIKLYAQDKLDTWNQTTVTYNSFPHTPWSDLLGEVSVNGQIASTHTIQTSKLFL